NRFLNAHGHIRPDREVVGFGTDHRDRRMVMLGMSGFRRGCWLGLNRRGLGCGGGLRRLVVYDGLDQPHWNRARHAVVTSDLDFGGGTRKYLTHNTGSIPHRDRGVRRLRGTGGRTVVGAGRTEKD